MIKVNEKFSISKDIQSWELTYFYMGKDKDGNDKQQSKKTWHADLKQVANKIVNIEAGEAKSMEELKDLLENAVHIVSVKLEELA